MVSDANTSNTETVNDFELSRATSSKSNRFSVNKLDKKLSRKKSPKDCLICEVKHGSKLDD